MATIDRGSRNAVDRRARRWKSVRSVSRSPRARSSFARPTSRSPPPRTGARNRPAGGGPANHRWKCSRARRRSGRSPRFGRPAAAGGARMHGENHCAGDPYWRGRVTALTVVACIGHFGCNRRSLPSESRSSRALQPSTGRTSATVPTRSVSRGAADAPRTTRGRLSRCRGDGGVRPRPVPRVVSRAGSDLTDHREAGAPHLAGDQPDLRDGQCGLRRGYGACGAVCSAPAAATHDGPLHRSAGGRFDTRCRGNGASSVHRRARTARVVHQPAADRGATAADPRTARHEAALDSDDHRHGRLRCGRARSATRWPGGLRSGLAAAVLDQRGRRRRSTTARARHLRGRAAGRSHCTA